MPNAYIVDMARPEILAELASYRDVDGLDHVADRDGQDVGDPASLSDNHLRELLKLARWRQLIWQQVDE